MNEDCRCDCTADCGDDPWLKDGRAQGCLKYRINKENERIRQLAVEVIREALKTPNSGMVWVPVVAIEQLLKVVED